MSTVLIGDIHPVTLAGFERAIAMHPHLRIVGAHRDAESLVEAAAANPDAVCVIDPGVFLGRASLYGRLIETGKKVLLCTSSDADGAEPTWEPTLRAWVVSKQATREALLRAIVLAAHGPGIAAQREPRGSRGLTPRERAIAAAAAEGLQNKEIAARFAITPGTVKIHLHSIFQKLGIESRAHLPAVLAAEGSSFPMQIAALARQASVGPRARGDRAGLARSA